MTADTTPVIKLTDDRRRCWYAPWLVTVKWKIELRNFSEIERALGRDVLNAFCRCFVHSNRLTSTINCLDASEKQHGRDSTAYRRDLVAMVWFTIGTLHELADAIKAAHDPLSIRGQLDPQSKHWATLRKVRKRWHKNKFRKMRNVAAFHVEAAIIDKGLEELAKQRVTELAEGQDEKNVHSTLSLGDVALFNGLELSLDDYGAFLEQVTADHVAVPMAVQTAFLDAADAAGVVLEGDSARRRFPVAGVRRE